MICLSICSKISCYRHWTSYVGVPLKVPKCLFFYFGDEGCFKIETAIGKTLNTSKKNSDIISATIWNGLFLVKRFMFTLTIVKLVTWDLIYIQLATWDLIYIHVLFGVIPDSRPRRWRDDWHDKEWGQEVRGGRGNEKRMYLLAHHLWGRRGNYRLTDHADRLTAILI